MIGKSLCFSILTALVIATTFFAKTVIAQEYTTAREVLEANLEATGGRSDWQDVRAVTLAGTRRLDTPMGKRESVFKTRSRYPGFSRTEETINSEMGPMEQLVVSTPEGRWTKAMQGTRELPANEWISSRFAKDELFLLSDDRVQLGALEKEIDETGPVYVVFFTFNGESYRRKYNQFTLFLTAAEAPGNDGSKNWSSFDDYREVNGFNMPFAWESVASITMNRNGEESTNQITVATSLESVTFNEEMSDDLFMK